MQRKNAYANCLFNTFMSNGVDWQTPQTFDHRLSISNQCNKWRAECAADNHLIFYHLKLFLINFYWFELPFAESRESVRVREKRGKVARASPIEFNTDVTQDLDANEGDRPLPELETSFLSPSVRKYLELGELSRSIPGKTSNQSNEFLIRV